MKKKQVIILCSVLLAVVLIALASSYALFTFNVTKDSNFKIAIGNLELSITDTTTEDKYILEDTVPTKDSVALASDGYTFTIKNTGNIDSYYDIYLDDIVLSDAGDRLDNSYIKFNLTNNNTNTGNTYWLTDYPDVDRIITSDYVKAGDSVTYTLRMWVDYEVGNEAQNKYFATQIRVVGTQKNAIVYEEKLLNGATPVLTNNLVPVEIDDAGKVTKADLNSKWYSYEDKRWANAVVTKNSYDTLNSNGKVNGATKNDGYVTFDGVDDYIDSGLENYDFGNSITIAVKVNIKNSSSQFLGNLESAGGVLWTNAKNYPAFNLYFENADKYVSINNPKALEYNKDYLLVGTYDGSVMRLYVDGVLLTSLEISDEIKPSSVSFLIGANPNPNGNHSSFANFDAYQVAIFDRAVTEEEIKKGFTDDIKIYNSAELLVYEDFTEKTYSNDEVIPEDSIESYFVWIPKYSYKLWDLGNYSSLTSISSKEQTINVKFGLTNTDDSVTGECTTPGIAGESGNCAVGEYMTHPAFLAFDTNGLWVGKFETGYDGATTTATAQVNSSDSSKIIIKPNVYSWRSLTLGNMFKASLEYIEEDNSHMMKNTEWGSVAYLQHSAYGSQTSVRINNNNSYITGYAATMEPSLAFSASMDGNRYETTELGIDGEYTVNYLNSASVVASTTGNYTGIYDMSGGAWEYTMGYTTVAATEGGTSGITDLYSTFFTDSSYEKYYDKYSSTVYTNYDNRILGDATGEMGPFRNETDPDETVRVKSSWYKNYATYITSSNPWFERGGRAAVGTLGGAFAFANTNGKVSSWSSYRIVLAPTK